MSRKKGRLEEARLWCRRHTFRDAKHAVRAYRKRFGVDRGCALHELTEFGVLDPVTRELTEAGRGEREEPWSDETFAFIAGYTSGGAPYGITWEQMEEIGRRDAEAEQAAREARPPVHPPAQPPSGGMEIEEEIPFS